IGGLARFVETLHTSVDSDDVTRVADLLREYARLGPSGRAERLKEAMHLLRGGELAAPSTTADRDVAPTSSVAPPAPTPRPRRDSPPPAGVTLTTPIQSLNGIGPVRARLYTRLNIRRVRDLLFHFPARHQPYPPVTPIADLFFQAE